MSLALAGCASKPKKPQLAYEERPVELLYATGSDRMDKHLWSQAVNYFAEVERQHPYSEWSRRAILPRLADYRKEESLRPHRSISSLQTCKGLNILCRTLFVLPQVLAPSDRSRAFAA